MIEVQERERTPNPLLRRQRELRGWSQGQVALELQARFPGIAVTARHVARWESGKRRPGPYYREKLCVLFQTTADKLGFIPQDASFEHNGEGTGTTQEGEPSSLWTVPSRRNPFFTGRDQLLETIRKRFVNNGPPSFAQTQALCGLGGIGKTQIALEYAYRYRDAYQFVLWVRAARSTLLADFVALADLLNLPEKDQSVLVASIKRWFVSHDRWLLIFDNVDEIEPVYDLLPAELTGHVLLTTRIYALGTFAHRVEVEKMNAEEGALLLLRRAKMDNGSSFEQINREELTNAKVLVDLLDGLPLALDQAGAYIEETACTVTNYVKAYRSRQSFLLNRRGSPALDHPDSVGTTFSLSFEQVLRVNPLAADLLRLCAFLDPDVIPQEVIRAYIQTSGVSLGTEDVDAQIRVDEAIGLLLRFSMIQRSSKKQGQTLTIHRLVQATIQGAMDKDARHAWIEQTTQVVRRAFPSSSFVYSTSGHPHYAVQLLRVSIHKNQEYGNKEQLASELWKLAAQQQVLGRLKASEQSLQESLILSHEIGDRFHEAKTHQYLALLRAYQGLFPASFTHLKTATTLMKEANIVGLESAISAYQSLCALLAGDLQKALVDAQCALAQANARQDERDMIRAEWVLGNALIRLTAAESANDGSCITQLLEQAETHLRDALVRCRRSKIVDYEADLLLAWARLHMAKGDHVQARASAMEALAITNCSTFRVLRADIRVLLARLALADGDRTAAMLHAQAAFDDASCDGIPYCYQSALEDAEQLLEQELLKV
jgi:transcriptional regulator with XRE-family HTH domain